jgi:cullin 3
MAHSDSKCNFPIELVNTSKSFEQFYLSRHSGRCLTWQPSLGNADVRVTFNKRKHDLNVSTFALVILLLFENLEDEGFLTYSVRLIKFQISAALLTFRDRKLKMQLESRIKN